MTRRRLPWLLIAVLLFAAAAWLMATADHEEGKKSADPRVEFRHNLSGDEWKRMDQRRTLPEHALPATPQQPAPPPRPRDPLLAALPQEAGKTAVVFEANALTNSPVGDLLLACLRRGPDDPIAAMKRDTGIDVLKDLDRVAISKGALVLSGQFGDAQWQKLAENSTGASYGDKGTIFTPQNGGHEYLARWGNQMMMLARNEQDAKDAIDRMEGRVAVATPPIDESETYGEVYGVLGVEELGKMLGNEQPELAKRLTEAASKVQLHVSAMGDVGITADVNGSDPEKATDLAKTLGAALSLARLKAQASGDHNLADLLDLAKVSPNGTNFAVEVALPMAFLEKHLAFCRQPWSAPDAGQGLE